MTPYTVEFHAKASAEVYGLPEDAYKLLLETLVLVRRDPWSCTRQDRPDDELYRWAEFGDAGMVYLRLDPDRRIARVYGVTWIG